MAIVTEYLSDFSGGEVDIISSLETAENEWLTLLGFVFDNSRRIRTQWAFQEWDAALPDDDSGSGSDSSSS